MTLVLSPAHFAHSQTSNKSAKVRRILELQSKINGFHNSEKMVTSQMKFAEKNPKTNVLKDPSVLKQIVLEIDESYINEMSQKLSDKEIDYLISLYSSPLYQKYINLEKDFWNKKAPQLMNEKISSYQKKAPKKK